MNNKASCLSNFYGMDLRTALELRGGLAYKVMKELHEAVIASLGGPSVARAQAPPAAGRHQTSAGEALQWTEEGLESRTEELTVHN